MDRDVEDMVRECYPCSRSDKSGKVIKVPVQKVECPITPWTKLAVVIFGLFANAPRNRRFLIVLIDYHSRWPEVKGVEEVSSNVVIRFLSDTFARFGMPEELVTDNGAQFCSTEFRQYLSTNGITHRRIAVYNPTANT
jgi:transposase InsO family protein